MTMKQVHIELSELAEAEMEVLRIQLGLKSISEVIRASVALTNFLVNEVKQGHKIIIRKPNGDETEITMNFQKSRWWKR